MFDTHVTVVGNLVADPRIAFTKEGQAVASFRLASTPRRFDRGSGEWRDGDTLFTNVTCWRGLAENVAASLKKGSSAIVMGRLSVHPYETRDGDQRQSVDIDAMAVGPELARAITIVKRAERGVVSSSAGDAAVGESPLTDAGASDNAADGTVEAGDLVFDRATEAELGEASAEALSTDGSPIAAGQTATEPPLQLASSGSGRWRSRGDVG